MSTAKSKSGANYHNFSRRSTDDLRSKFKSFVKDKDASAQIIKDYLNSVNPSVTALIEALMTFNESQKESTVKVQDLLKQAMDVLKEELARDLSETQRNNIYHLIVQIIQEARKEAQEHRSANRALAAIGGGAVLALVGGGIYLATKGKEKDLLVKGAQMMFRK